MKAALQQPRVRRVVYPLLVAVFVIAAWQGLVVGFELPPYLVPSPLLMIKTLIADRVALGLALLVTVKITVLAFLVARAIRSEAGDCHPRSEQSLR